MTGEISPAAQPRTLQELLDEASRLSPDAVTAHGEARALVAEAYALGVEDTAARYRRSLGQAYGTMLGLIPDETWQDIRHFYPDLWGQLLAGQHVPQPACGTGSSNTVTPDGGGAGRG